MFLGLKWNCASPGSGLLVLRPLKMKSFLAVFSLFAIASCASVERGTRSELVGHWRYVDSSQSCDYSFKDDGSFTGAVKHQKKVVSKFTGRWSVKNGALLYTYMSDEFDRIPAGATDRDQLVEVTKDSFLIEATNGERRRYLRVP
ncbi:MAG: hypothetical protein QOJ87_543 [Verrucomicrobiota bacterium]